MIKEQQNEGTIEQIIYALTKEPLYLKNEEISLEGNYFACYLKFALEHSNKQVSDTSGKAETVQRKKFGVDIDYDGELSKIYCNSRQGRRRVIEHDVRIGVWRKKLYGVNAEKPKDGRG